jgi:hypothetical protein
VAKEFNKKKEIKMSITYYSLRDDGSVGTYWTPDSSMSQEDIDSYCQLCGFTENTDNDVDPMISTDSGIAMLQSQFDAWKSAIPVEPYLSEAMFELNKECQNFVLDFLEITVLDEVLDDTIRANASAFAETLNPQWDYYVNQLNACTNGYDIQQIDFLFVDPATWVDPSTATGTT